MTLPDAVAAPRLHHQGLPDRIELERGGFTRRGHRFAARHGAHGDVQRRWRRAGDHPHAGRLAGGQRPAGRRKTRGILRDPIAPAPGAFRAALAATMVATTSPAALAAQSPVADWVVAPRPTTVIGGSNAGRGGDLAGVSSAHRLSDGDVAVANGDPLALRLFDAAGRLIRTIGRGGAGPGEFRSQVMVFAGGARFAAGLHQRQRPLGVVQRRPDSCCAKSRAATAAVSARPAAVPARLRDARVRTFRSPAYGRWSIASPIMATARSRKSFPDRDGRFWVIARRGDRSGRLRCQGAAAGPRERCRRTTRLLDVAPGAVVVLARDADDVERVEVWPVTMTAPGRPVVDPCYHAAAERRPLADRRGNGPAQDRLCTTCSTSRSATPPTTHRYPADLNAMHYPLERGRAGAGPDRGHRRLGGRARRSDGATRVHPQRRDEGAAGMALRARSRAPPPARGRHRAGDSDAHRAKSCRNVNVTALPACTTTSRSTVLAATAAPAAAPPIAPTTVPVLLPPISRPRTPPTTAPAPVLATSLGPTPRDLSSYW